MAYHPILYKLLGVPDSGTEPTAYVLLGIGPEQCTPEAVQSRLQDCRKRLRQGIPGPQFIPLVTLWEKELALAAETISDPRKREAYHGAIAREAEQRRAEGVPLHRPEQGVAVRDAIDRTVNPDWTLEESRRPVLADRLRALRITEPRVRSSLGDLPRPSPKTSRPIRGAVGFYARAVDLSLSQGLLLAGDEAALLALAQKLTLSRDVAASTLEARLAARGARRAAARPAAPAALDDEQVLQTILAEEAPPRGHERGRWWLLLVPTGAALLFIGAALIFIYGMPQVRPPAGPPVAVTGSDQPVASEAAAKLYAAMLTAAEAPSDLADVTARAPAADLRQALVLAAQTLADADNPAESAKANLLYKNLLGPAPLQAAQQDAAVQALIDTARQLKTVGGQYRVLRQLWQALWLTKDPPIIATAQDEARLVALCDKAWQESLRQAPDDPLRDPVRLSEALGKGGDLRLLAAYANQRQFDPVVDSLAKQALGPAGTESSRALQSLLGVAMVADPSAGGPGEAATRKIRLALCDVLRRTDNPGTALRIRTVLLRALGRDAADAAFTTGDMSVAADRRELADRLMGLVVAAGPVPVPPVAVTPTPTPTSPSVVRPAVSGPSAADIRGGFAVADRPDTVLAGAVLCLVACQDRAAALTGDRAARPAEDVATLLAAADRPAALTRAITLAPMPMRPVASPAVTSSAAPSVDALKKDLASTVLATRYKAVEGLREADSAESAEALLAALKKTSVGGAAIDQRTSYRILGALKSMRPPGAATAMADMLGDCRSPAVAYHMVRTIEAASGLAARLDGRLTLVNQPEARKTAARWWNAQLSKPSIRPITPIRPTSPSVTPSAAAPAAAPWRPDATLLKMLGAGRIAAAATAATLKDYRWAGGAASAAAGPSGAAVGPEVGEELARSLEAVVGQLDRLVREHPAGKSRLARADKLLQERQARLLASDTSFQRSAVELDAMAALLEVLIDEEDAGGTLKAEVARLSNERRAALASAPDVFHEMREAACSSLALWDVLLAARAGKGGP